MIFLKPFSKLILRTVVYTVDFFLTVFLIGSAVVMFWRSSWVLLDLYLFPEDLSLSSTISLVVGIFILFLLQLVIIPVNKVFQLYMSVCNVYKFIPVENQPNIKKKLIHNIAPKPVGDNNHVKDKSFQIEIKEQKKRIDKVDNKSENKDDDNDNDDDHSEETKKSSVPVESSKEKRRSQQMEKNSINGDGYVLDHVTRRDSKKAMRFLLKHILLFPIYLTQWIIIYFLGWAAVFTWRGYWYLWDLYVLPDSPLLSNIICQVYAIIVLIVFNNSSSVSAPPSVAFFFHKESLGNETDVNVTLKNFWKIKKKDPMIEYLVIPFFSNLYRNNLENKLFSKREEVEEQTDTIVETDINSLEKV